MKFICKNLVWLLLGALLARGGIYVTEWQWYAWFLSIGLTIFLRDQFGEVERI